MDLQDFDYIGQFPDRPPSGSNRPPATIANVDHLLAHYRVAVRYNEVKKRDEIDIPGRRGSADNTSNVTLSHVVSLAARHHMPTGLVPSFVEAIANRDAYNPMRDWMRSRAWDGTDRFPELFRTVRVRDGYPADFAELLIRKWMRAAAAAHFVPGFHTRGVLVLQGDQSLGKSSWIRRLVNGHPQADEMVKLGHHLDPSNKDSIISAISFPIVELGELDSSFKKDVARLKGFLTDSQDSVRRPYDRREATFPRRTVFTASVNETTFLVDSTGNTRFWTIAAAALDYLHEIDTQQLFAQAAAEVQQGGTWWLTPDEERRLEDVNGAHQAAGPALELLAEAISRDGEPISETQTLTASEVARKLDMPATNASAREMGTALRRLIGEPRKLNGIYKWRVPWRDVDKKAWVKPATNDNAAQAQERRLAGPQPGDVY